MKSNPNAKPWLSLLALLVAVMAVIYLAGPRREPGGERAAVSPEPSPANAAQGALVASAGGTDRSGRTSDADTLAALEPGHVRLRVRVVHAQDGLPIEGAVVSVQIRERGDAGAAKKARATRLTNERGQSSWSVPPGSTCEVGVAQGHHEEPPVSSVVDVPAATDAAAAPPTLVDLELAPRDLHPFHARFFEQTSALPVPGLVLEHESSQKRLVCDAEGRFSAVDDGRGQMLLREPSRWTILHSKGSTTFRIASSEYFDAQVKLDAEHADVPHEMLVLVSRAANLRGTVVRPDGSAGPDTSVRLHWEAEPAGTEMAAFALARTTDRRGLFEFERLPAGQVMHLVARGLFGERWHHEMDVTLEPGETRELEIRLEPRKSTPPPAIAERPRVETPPIRATATVLRPDGTPAAHAELSILDHDGRNSVEDRELGSFVLELDSPARVKLVATETDEDGRTIAALERSVEVTAGAHFELRLAAVVQIRGRIVDPVGGPVGGLDVRCRSRVSGARWGTLWSEFAPSEDDGSFSIDVVPGEYELDVADSAFVSATVRVVAPVADVILTLPRTATLRGHVVDEESRPVPGAEVLFNMTDTSGSAESAADGKFEILRITPGMVTVRASLEHEMRAAPVTWTLVEGQIAVLPDLVLHRLAHVHVLGEGTGDTVRIELTQGDARLEEGPLEARAVFHVPPGEIVLKVSVDGRLVETKTIVAKVDEPVLVRLAAPR